MENAITYVENLNLLVSCLLKAGHRSVEIQKGRRFDRVLVEGATLYFVEHDSTVIYGAKSASQYNPRRIYGTLATVEQYDWSTATPLPNTEAALALTAREAAIMAAYKRRGRPRKVSGAQP